MSAEDYVDGIDIRDDTHPSSAELAEMIILGITDVQLHNRENPCKEPLPELATESYLPPNFLEKETDDVNAVSELNSMDSDSERETPTCKTHFQKQAQDGSAVSEYSQLHNERVVDKTKLSELVSPFEE